MKASVVKSVIFVIMVPVVFLGVASASDVKECSWAQPPAQAIVLFDGKNFDQFENENGGEIKWTIIDGAMQVIAKTGNIATKQKFGDFQLHLEFMLPADSQETNSGVYIQQRYEVQVIDSHKQEDSPGMCASLYRQKVPDYNVCKAPGQWQSYDIIFRSARWDGEKKIEDARITVIHNGTVVHNNVSITSKTGAGKPEGPDPLPIRLQDHTGKVKYRNIWIVENKEKPLPEDKK
jgi:hypothetical protein